MVALKMSGKKCTAKRKYEDEHRTFLTEWESSYFLLNVMASHGKPKLSEIVTLASYLAWNIAQAKKPNN